MMPGSGVHENPGVEESEERLVDIYFGVAVVNNATWDFGSSRPHLHLPPAVAPSSGLCSRRSRLMAAHRASPASPARQGEAGNALWPEVHPTGSNRRWRNKIVTVLHRTCHGAVRSWTGDSP